MGRKVKIVPQDVAVNNQVKKTKTAGKDAYIAKWTAYAGGPEGWAVTDAKELAAEAERRWDEALVNNKNLLMEGGPNEETASEYRINMVEKEGPAKIVPGVNPHYNAGTHTVVLGDGKDSAEEITHPLNVNPNDRRRTFAAGFTRGTRISNVDGSGKPIRNSHNYVAGPGNERSAAMSSLLPYAFARYGNRMGTPGDMQSFWNAIAADFDEFVKDNKDAPETASIPTFIQRYSSAVPANGRDLIGAFIEAHTAKEKNEDQQKLLDWLLNNSGEMGRITENNPLDYAPDAKKEVMADEAGGTSRRMSREMHPSKPTPEAKRPTPTAPRPENAEPARGKHVRAVTRTADKIDDAVELVRLGQTAYEYKKALDMAGGLAAVKQPLHVNPTALAAAVAVGSVASAVEQGADLLDFKEKNGYTWGDVARGARDVLTTGAGLRNFGRGLAGSLMDVASFVDPFGVVPDGDKIRDTMEDAKGGNVRADEAGGDVAPDADPAVSDKPPVGEREPSPEPSTPARIIINPKVFKDKRDGLCVAYNEAFRVLMEMNGFDPQAEPTEEQRKFFSDTAYANDEVMLRRTILARICTFDDSVKNPTDEQLDEALEFLETVMEIGAPQSEEEQANVQRIHDMIAEIRKAPRPEETPAEEAPVESEAPPVADIGGGWTRDENGRLPGSNWMRDENGRLPGSGRTVETSEPIDWNRGASRELRREQRERKVLAEYRERTAGDIGEGLSPEVDTEPQTEIPIMTPEQTQEGTEPAAQPDGPAAQPDGPAAPDQNDVRVGRRADGSLAEGSLRDMRDEYGRLVRNDAKGGKATDDTYVTNSAVVMPEDKAREMGAVTQDLEHVGNGQVSIPFDVFRMNGATVDADQLLAESYGSKEAAETAKNAAMEARARRYSSAPSEAAMKDPESVRVVPAGVRPGPWDEAYLSYAARAGHGNLKTIKSGPFIHTAGYVPGMSLGFVPTRVLGTSSPAIEVRRMLNSQVGETGESAGNGRVVSLTDAANPNKPGWYTADEGYRAAALGSIKGWLTANKRAPGEGADLAAVMAAAYRDKASLKLGKIDKNGKDFLASVAKAYDAERKGTASRRDKEVLEAARNTDMWEQVVGARRYDRYSTMA